MSTQSTVVRQTVKLLARRLRNILAVEDFSDKVTSQDIVMMMLGMQNMGSEVPEVQAFMNEVALLMDGSKVYLQGFELSSAFFSLKSMGGGKPINFNTQRLKGFSAEDSCNQGDEYSEADEDRRTLKTSTKFNGKSNSFHFRQTYSHWTSKIERGDNKELIFSCTKKRFRLPSAFIALLSALERKLAIRREPLTGPMICTALFGLQGLTADSVPVCSSD